MFWRSQSLDRCASLDDTLARLARVYPAVKFLRARAGALGFATTSSATSRRFASATPSNSLSAPPFPLRRTPSRKILVPGRIPEEDEDEDNDDGGDDEDDEGSEGGWEGRDRPCRQPCSTPIASQSWNGKG